MKPENKELVIDCIKNGGLLAVPEIEVFKLLDIANMGGYGKACCNRIVMAGLVDDNHVSWIKKGGPDLVMDWYGLQACEGIIKGYVDETYFSKIMQYLEYRHSQAILLNNMLYTLRNQSRTGLQGMLKEISSLDVTGDYQVDGGLVAAELKSRYPFPRIRIFMRRLAMALGLATQFYVPILKYPWFLSCLWETVKGEEICTERFKGRYYDAFARFKTHHRNCGNPGRMEHGLLIQYIFLGVKAFGNEYRRKEERKIPKSCHEIDRMYKESSLIMEAIGCLTPQELLYLFPVEKRYDGEKNESKDYFWTLEKLKEKEAYKPIGDEYDVARLLWDYQNDDLMFFFFCWENALYDMKCECNRGELVEEYHSRFRNKGVQVG